jgi:hypothetical protein
MSLTTASIGDEDFTKYGAVLVDTDSPEADQLLSQARDRHTPSVLISALRPIGPWFLDLEPEARTTLMPLWGQDFDRRRARSLDLLADAYADSPKAIAEAVSELLTSAKGISTGERPSKGPSLCYRGALFNELECAIGTCFELPVGQDAILGRGKGVSILMHSPHVARHHMRFHLRPDGTVEMTDLGGSNGNWICKGDQPTLQLKPGQTIDLNHGDELALAGDYRLRYLRG